MGNKQAGNVEYAGFPSTHWSEISRAAQARLPDLKGPEPLGGLLKRYYPALLAHLVYVKRIPIEQAEDLLHDFLERKFLKKNILETADPAKGRFRTFLLTVLDRFLVSRHRQAAAQKRSPGQLADFEECARTVAVGNGEGSYDQVWARQVLAETLKRMRQECASSGRDDLWNLFEARVLRPCLTGAEPIPYDEMVSQFQLASPSAAYNLLLTAKRMYVRCLKSVVADYAPSEALVEEELANLRAILAGNVRPVSPPSTQDSTFLGV